MDDDNALSSLSSLFDKTISIENFPNSCGPLYFSVSTHSWFQNVSQNDKKTSFFCDFMVELAPSGMSHCKGCGGLINKKMPRIGYPVKDPRGKFGFISSLFHPVCIRAKYDAFLKQQKSLFFEPSDLADLFSTLVEKPVDFEATKQEKDSAKEEEEEEEEEGEEKKKKKKKGKVKSIKEEEKEPTVILNDSQKKIVEQTKNWDKILGGFSILSLENRAIVLKELFTVKIEKDEDCIKSKWNESKLVERDETIPCKETPPEMVRELLKFQKEGHYWLCAQEKGDVKGGILADEMGMGKTIQMIALLLSNRTNKLVCDENIKKSGFNEGSGGTLIVAPLAAVNQWKSEIENFVDADALKVAVYHGVKREKMNLKDIDILIVSYATLEADYRKIINTHKIECEYCEKMFLPEKLYVHQKYFCGPEAEKTAKQSLQTKKKSTAKAMETLKIEGVTPTPSAVYKELMLEANRSEDLSRGSAGGPWMNPRHYILEKVRVKLEKEGKLLLLSSSKDNNNNESDIIDHNNNDNNNNDDDNAYLAKLGILEIRKLLTELNLPAKGSKVQMLERLKNHLSGEKVSTPPPGDEEYINDTLICNNNESSSCNHDDANLKKKNNIDDANTAERCSGKTNNSSSSSSIPPAPIMNENKTSSFKNKKLSKNKRSKKKSDEIHIFTSDDVTKPDTPESNNSSKKNKKNKKNKNNVKMKKNDEKNNVKMKTTPVRKKEVFSGTKRRASSCVDSLRRSSRLSSVRTSSFCEILKESDDEVMIDNESSSSGFAVESSSFSESDESSADGRSSSEEELGCVEEEEEDESFISDDDDDRYIKIGSKRPDVILTKPLNLIVKQNSFLHSIKWDRIVLDEAHKIKSRNTSTAKAAYELQCDGPRWCLSGTPLQNRIGELYSLIRFLKFDPFAYYLCSKKNCDCKSLNYEFEARGYCKKCHHTRMAHFSYFNRNIVKPIQSYGFNGEGKIAIEKLKKNVLNKIMLRRTKTERADDVNLPELSIEIVKVDLSDSETDFYKSLYKQTSLEFNTFAKAGTILHNFAHIFDLLSRLRQAVDHPYLIVHGNTTSNMPTDSAGGQSTCVICLEDIGSDVLVTSKCRHSFHRECVTEYLESAPSDPQNSNSTYIGCPKCYVPLTVDLLASNDANANNNSLDNSKSLKSKQVAIMDKIKKSEYKSSTKIDIILKHINKDEKTLIFSQYTSMLDLIEYQLKLNEIFCGKYTGSLALIARTNMLKAFNEDINFKILLISLKAGGEGLNLQIANNIILIDPWWNPAAEMQAIQRAHRIGQTKPVKALRLIAANTIEERMLQLQEKKSLVFEGTIGQSDAANAKLSSDDIKFLFAS